MSATKMFVIVAPLLLLILQVGCAKPDYRKFEGNYRWQKDEGANILLSDRGAFIGGEGISNTAITGRYEVKDNIITATIDSDIGVPGSFQIQDFRDGKAQFRVEDESLVSIETGERFDKQDGKFDVLTKSFLEDRFLRSVDLSSYLSDEIVLLPGHDMLEEVFTVEKASTLTITKQKYLDEEKVWRPNQKGAEMSKFLNILGYRTITKAGELSESLEGIFRTYNLDSRFMGTINKLKNELRSNDTMVLVKKNDGSKRLHFIFVWRDTVNGSKLVMEFID